MRHAARVTNVEDPEKRGRVKVVCASILGDEDSELPGWVVPMLQWGWFIVPEIGEEVDIELPDSTNTDENRFEQITAAASYTWTGARAWVKTDEADRSVPDEVGKNYGKRRMFKTPAGHVLMFDDTKGQEQVYLQWTNGIDSSYVGLEPSGSVVVSNKAGSMLNLDAAGAASLWHASGKFLQLSADGATLVGGPTSFIDVGANINLITAGSVVLTGGGVKLDSLAVYLGRNAAAVSLNMWTFTLHTILQNWVPVPLDGGMALKTALGPLIAMIAPGNV